MSSTVTSAKPRCDEGSNADSGGSVISPERMKPKKHVVTAAHSMKASVS